MMSSDSDGDEQDESGYPVEPSGNQIVVASNGNQTILHGGGTRYHHQCPVCMKVFGTTKGLVQHSIIHTDRKPFSCEICSKAFRFKSNLFEHRSIHSGEQPFVCPFCGKACRLKGNLKKHLRTHCKEPSEIEQAYEAVTTAHASGASFGEMTAVGGNEYEEEMCEDYEGTPATFRLKRRLLPPNRTTSTPSKIAMDENKPIREGARIFPSLREMFDSRFSTEDFIRAARAMPFEKYDCNTCRLTFNCRYDMESHCENAHDLSRRLVNARNGAKSTSKPMHWCEVCLREFDDAKSYDQHLFIHRRIRALINKGEIRVNEPQIRPVV